MYNYYISIHIYIYIYYDKSVRCLTFCALKSFIFFWAAPPSLLVGMMPMAYGWMVDGHDFVGLMVGQWAGPNDLNIKLILNESHENCVWLSW